MASRSQEFVTSPFENVLNFLGSLPQGHEKAVKHALYNALALFLLLVCIAAGWALFIVLEPFIKPLIWALLCGSVLHPFKYSLATVLHSWLQTMESSSTMLFVGIPMLPINVIDDISEKIGGTFQTHLKKLLGLAGTGAVLHVLYTYTPTICTTIVWKLGILGNIALLWLIQHFTTAVAVTVLLAYVIILAIWWHPSRSRHFMYAAFVVWSLMGCYVANFIEAFQVSIFFFILILLVAGFAIEVHQIHNNLKETDKPVSYTAIVRWVLMMRDDPQDSFKELENLSKTEHEKPPKEEIEENDDQEVTEGDRPESPKSSMEVQPGAVPQRIQRLDRPPSALARRGLRGSLYIRELSYIDLFDEETNESGKYIYGVLWGCGIMLLYKNNWLLMLCPLPLFIYVVKHLGFYIGLWDFLLGRIQRVIDEIKNWCAVRKHALFPAPVLGLFKLGATVNKTVIEILMSSVDSAASVVVILGITLFSIFMSIFVALQVYAEGIHLVHMGASIINNTVVAHSDLLGTIPEDWQEQMNSVLDNVYSYGREGISKMVRGWMKDVEDQKAALLEKQILELWDRVYQSWMMSSSEPSLVGPVVSPAAAFASWDGIMEALKKSPELFNMSAVVNFAKENIEMLASLLDSLWAIFKGNVSVAFYSCTALINIVFGGGTAVLNFLLNLVVFLTALFYLLSSSGELYKPVDLITNFSPVMGNRFATAIEKAVMGVFRASFKMAVFYGLWTWFVHNLFDVKIVYLPSVIAAILAVVPFLGTYWACIPAVAELWLLHDRGMLALLLLLFQFLPTSVVDTTFYKEIKGGGHPYLTGLSIAGGIFCMGAEGAIVGPLLLCGLFVAVNMSGSLMKESPSEPHFPSHLGHVSIPGSISQMSRLKRMDTVI